MSHEPPPCWPCCLFSFIFFFLPFFFRLFRLQACKLANDPVMSFLRAGTQRYMEQHALSFFFFSLLFDFLSASLQACKKFVMSLFAHAVKLFLRLFTPTSFSLNTKWTTLSIENPRNLSLVNLPWTLLIGNQSSSWPHI